MSGTGSLMIRNLRKPSDYSKGAMTQDELLRIAIANDANISQARKNFQQGEIYEPLPQQTKSPAELQADTAFQEKTALDNLLKLFVYREAGDIISQLNPDELFVLNTTFPQIERDIKKKFNLKLLSPSFFIEYLRKWMEELNASKGISTNLSSITNKFNTLTDNINDIMAIMPTKNQFDILGSYLDKQPQSIVAPLLERLRLIQDAIPSKRDLEKVSGEQEILQFETLNMLQDVTANLPTQNQLSMLIEDIRSNRISQATAITQIEELVSSISNRQLDSLDEIRRDIAESSLKGKSIDISIENKIELPVLEVPALAIAKKVSGGTPSGASSLYIVYASGNNELVDSKYLDRLYRQSEDFRNWYGDRIGGKPTLSTLKDYIKTRGLTEGASQESVSEFTGTTKQGYGLKKAKNGRIITKKIGQGVAFNPEPTYRQLGKYVVNMPQLKERDILNVKFPSLGRIPQFKPTPISDIFKDFLLDLLETGKLSNRIYDQVPIEERQLFERVATGAGIIHTLKLKRTITDDDKADNERFTLLKGEYLAGNNSVALLKELRKLVVKFMGQGKILKKDGMDLLIELSI